MTDDGGLAVLELVGRRLDFLERLRGEPAEKRSLVDGLEHSRSTVDRALRELETAGLVARSDGAYRTTLAGRLLADTYREFVARSGDVVAAAEALSPLPADAPVDERLVAGARTWSLEGGPVDLPEPVTTALATADRVRCALATASGPMPIDRMERRAMGSRLDVELLVDGELYGYLRRRFPESLRALAATGNVVRRGPVPPFNLLVVEEDESVLVVVVTYTDDGVPHGVLANDGPDARAWASGLLERVREGAEDVSEAARSLPVEAGEAGPGESRRMLATAGFVRLSEDYLAGHEPVDLPTAWRTGLDLAEVDAGLAVPREREVDDERRDLATDLLVGLEHGTDHALLGPPGAGKSTVCKAVACRWFADEGPVYYRAGGGEPFAAPTVLASTLRSADGDGPTLVVVEDAVRPEATAVFEVMREFAGRDDVVFLLDARTDEWRDPPGSLPADAERHRSGPVETVPMPPLDEREVRRFVERFEAATGRTVETPPDRLLAQVRDAEVVEGPGAAELLLLVHRLTRRAGPADDADGPPSSALLADVRGTCGRLREAGGIAIDVGIGANLLNAADLAIHPAVLHAVADDADGVAAGLDVLRGRTLFEPRESGAFRTVHPAWSMLFLREFLTEVGERDAHRRVGRVLSAVLRLADESAARERIDREFAGEAPELDRIAAAPAEWAEGVVERVFAVGSEYPALAPLFGRPGYDAIELPAVCPPALAARTLEWRGRMTLNAGELDRAEAAYERLAEAADDHLERDEATQLHAKALGGLGKVELHRGDADAAEGYYRECLEAYEALADRRRVADVHNNLGIVAWLRGELDAAERRHRESLATYRELGDRQGEAYTLHNLGNVVDARGDSDAAEGHYRDALALYREAGTPSDEADCLNNLGVLAEVRGDLDEAAEYYARALERHREIGAGLGAANARLNLGIVARKQGYRSRAREYADRAREAFADIGDTGGEAAALQLQADLALDAGDPDRADERAGRALELAREIGDRKEEAAALRSLGRARLLQGDPEAARERATAALEIDREVGRPRAEAACGRLLARTARERGDHGAAADHLSRALELARKADARFRVGRLLAERGALAADRGDRETAVEDLAAAAEIYEECGARRAAVQTHERLADLRAAAGEDVAAAEHEATARRLAEEADLQPVDDEPATGREQSVD